MHREEALVDLAVVVEHGPAHLLLGPGDRSEVRVDPVPAGEDLVPVADRVEEVDGVAAGDAVPGGRDVDGHAVEGQQVGGLADPVPVVQPEGEVVQRAVRPGDDGDVVRGVRRSRQGASWGPSVAMICSGSRNSSTSRKDAGTPATSPALEEMWSRRGGAV